MDPELLDSVEDVAALKRGSPRASVPVLERRVRALSQLIKQFGRRRLIHAPKEVVGELSESCRSPYTLSTKTRVLAVWALAAPVFRTMTADAVTLAAAGKLYAEASNRARRRGRSACVAAVKLSADHTAAG